MKKRKKLYESGGGVHSASDRAVHRVMFVILFLLSFICLYPFLLVLSSSFQSQETIYSNGYRVFTEAYTADAYKLIIKEPGQILNAYWVTIVTSVASTAIGVVACSACGYVMSRKEYPYRNILSFYVFFTMLFQGGMVPSYIMISKWLGLKNSIWVLILPLCVGSWNIMLMKGFFQSVPMSLVESAKLDGASEMRTFFSIVLPISKPAFATLGLFILLGSWNDYMNCLLYIEDERLVKLQYLLMRILNNVKFLTSPEALQYGLVTNQEIPTLAARFAMCVLAAGPIVVVFPFFQKYFTKGIALGGVKG